jgi:Bifunctional DNA primase/polymerase, N-terminal
MKREQKQTNNCLKEALRYIAEFGWAVFPANLRNGEKKSYKAAKYSGGAKWGMTQNPAQVERDFDMCREAGVGVPTGRVNGIIDIETDTPKGHGVDGGAALKKLEAELGPLPETLTFESPSGSRHRIFNYPKGLGPKVWIKTIPGVLGKGVDVKADGGMMIAPPSVRADGVYRWCNELPIADLPEAWVERIIELCTAKKAAAADQRDDKPSPNKARSREKAYAAAALAGVAEELADTEPGERNKTLNAVAYRMGRMVARKWIKREDVERALLEAAQACGLVGDDGEDQQRATIASGLKAGMQEPHDDLPEQAGGGYEVHNGGIYYFGASQFGTQLTNFTAKIVEEIKLDDASGVPQLQFVVDGSLGRAEIPAEQFDALRWVTREWGARARIIPGRYHKEKVADAIKALSGSAVTRTVYTHFGWRRIDGRWIYLHGGGGIGANGAVDTVEVKPGNALAQMVLPPVTNLRRAVRASLDLLEVAPQRITYPLWGAIYRAPLSEFAPTTVVPWLFGPSGVLKTSVALLAQAHYAPMVAARPMANWASTANANERLAFLAKDCLLLVDDFCPRGSAQDVGRMHGAGERLIRAAANRGGRGRMNADASLRPEMYPRGMLLGTGEDVPRGYSLRVRMVLLEVAADEVDLERLTELQQQTALLGEAMSGYVSWLAEQDKAQFAARQNELRAAGHGEHLRIPENFAELQLGIETGLRFAVDCGALSEAQAREHETAAAREMRRLARAQERLLRSEEPAERFVRLLGAVLKSGRAHVTTLAGGEPPTSESLGWREVAFDKEGDPVCRGQGRKIGWVAGDNIYLNEDAVYSAVMEVARDQQAPLEITKDTLWKRLDAAGLLIEKVSGRLTARVTTGDRRERALCLLLKSLFEADTAKVLPFPKLSERSQ